MAVCTSFVKTYDEAQDSTLSVGKRKIEEVSEAAEKKPKKAKLEVSTPTAATSGAAAFNIVVFSLLVCKI